MKFYKLDISKKIGEETSPPIIRGSLRGGNKTMNKCFISSMLILFFFTFFIQVLFAQIITVKQDGTGSFTTIQEGVDHAWPGDTVLVWPGTYFENIDFLGKSICLGGLAMTTGDMSYISQTIIDGNQTGGCIKIKYIQDTAEVNGFTLIHGIGSYFGAICGGGIFVRESDVAIKNCIIKNNTVTGYGGGILINESNTFLSNTTIKNNYSLCKGGGILILNGNVEFDSINLCNIYMNYAPSGTDLFKAGDSPPLHLMVDTFTVLFPDRHHAFSEALFGYPKDDTTFDISVGKIQQANENLYVNPAGDNSNSGLTQEEPLKNISYALLKIVSDSLHPNTIYLSNGVYAPSTGEKFPLNLRSYVSLQGQSRDSTILDAENYIYHLKGNVLTDNYSIKNLTLCNGNGNINSVYGLGSGQFFDNHNVIFKNILITQNKGEIVIISSHKCNNNTLEDVEFIDNIGGTTLFNFTSHENMGGYPPFTADTVRLKNCHINKNLPDYNLPDGGFGGGMVVQGTLQYQDSMICYITNCEINENIKRTLTPGEPGFSSLLVTDGANTYLVNSTIGNNYSPNPLGGSIGVADISKLHIYNSIIYGNDPAQFFMYSTSNGDSYLNIYNSLVQDGQLGIRVYTPHNQIYYDYTNIDTDPLWDTACMYPYSLSAGSPCINTGTLDLPEGVVLPETDIVGNPRIWDGFVDMGAYEYGPWVGIENQNSQTENRKSKYLSVSPNPFTYTSQIKYKTSEKGKMQIFVYNIQGNKVSTLMDVTGLSGSGEFSWASKNDYGQKLPTGTYIINLIINEKIVEAVKVVKE